MSKEDYKWRLESIEKIDGVFHYIIANKHASIKCESRKNKQEVLFDIKKAVDRLNKKFVLKGL